MPDWKATEADDIYPLLEDAANVLKVKNTLVETLHSSSNKIKKGPALRLLGISPCQHPQLYKKYGPDPKKYGQALVNHIADGFHPESERVVLSAALSRVVKDEFAKSGSALVKTSQQNIDDCDTLIQFAKDNPGPTWDYDGKIGSKDGQSLFRNKVKEYPALTNKVGTGNFTKRNALHGRKIEGEYYGWAGGFIRWIEGKKAEFKKQLEGSGKADADRKVLSQQALEIYKAVHKAVEDHELPKIRKAFQDDAARGAVRKMVDVVTQQQSEIYKRLYPRAEARAAHNKESYERAGAATAKNEKWKKALIKGWRAANMGWRDIGKYLKSRYAPKNNYPDYEDARFENGNYEGGDPLKKYVGI